MKKAFTLVEVLIVIAILGILAALVMPEFQNHIQLAKEAAAKDNLRILRNIIELYAARHGGVAPGYKDDDPSQNPSQMRFWVQIVIEDKYLKKIPRNPFNGLGYPGIKIIGNAEDFPDEPTGLYGWIYKPATKEIRLDWPGTDSSGLPYFSY